MGEYENQYLITHAKNIKNNKEEHSRKNKIFQKKDIAHLRCFTCDEKGHFAKYSPQNKGKNKRRNACIIEDGEPINKKAKEDSSSDKEYVF